MSTVYIASSEVLKNHVARLHDARTAMQRDVSDALRIVDQKLRDAALALAAAQEAVAELRNDLRRERDDPYAENSVLIRSLEDEIEQARRKAAAKEAQLALTKAVVTRTHVGLANLLDRYAHDHFRALSVIEAQDKNIQAFRAVQHATASNQPPTASHPPSAKAPLGPGPGSGANTTAAKPLPPLPGGLQWVALMDLDMQAIPANLAFKHATKGDMQQMMETFMTQLVPMLQADPTLTRGGLAAMDMVMGIGANGLVSPRSLAFAWDCMIGGTDLIALSAPRGGAATPYSFSSGRHRTLLAQSLGWTHVPARILGGAIP